jgi:CubicO group peptidase (beta-lactamase class C family)
MTDQDQHSASYYPPPESQGGWRWLASPDEVRSQAGMKEEAIDQARQVQEFMFGGDIWGIVIIRHGYLVREYYTFGATASTSFDIHSGTKSFTGTAWGLLLEDSRLGRLPHGQTVTLDSPAYDFLPEGAPLSDPRKALIRIRHLLTMTSGIPGEASGLFGTPTTTGNGPFEFALGRCPNRYGKWASQLSAEPGTRWDYSDPAMSHLSLAFAHIMQREMSDYLQERVFEPIGIEHLSWDILGGSGSIGPHSNAYTGIHISARELARFGYLFLHWGAWNGQQLIPRSWVELATRASQDLNPAYGYNWWVGARWPNLPQDTFALTGFRSNRCYIIPSLDLVVARVGTGPAMWDEGRLISSIVQAIV